MKLFKNIIDLLLKPLYPQFDFSIKDYPRKLLLKYAWKQKVCGYNRSVPWPVHWQSHIKAPENIVSDAPSPGYAPRCYLDARNGIHFGKNVLLGPGVSIISMNHDPLHFSTYIEGKPVVIGCNSWLGANCIILPQVVLGEHTIVGAGSVVTKSFPQGNVIIAGNPARVIKTLEPYREC